jgi:hypothetical protein
MSTTKKQVKGKMAGSSNFSKMPFKPSLASSPVKHLLSHQTRRRAMKKSTTTSQTITLILRTALIPTEYFHQYQDDDIGTLAHFQIKC